MAKPESTSKILKKRARKPPRGFLGRAVKWFLFLVAVLLIVAAGAGISIFFYFKEELPQISSLKDYRPWAVTTVYSDNNHKIAEFYKERRIVVPLEKIPAQLKQAFVAAEDDRFYSHQGIDLISIFRAFVKNLEAGTIVQGGSTITQQVTKSFLLTPERSYRRKIKEAMLAYQIDSDFTKDEILYLYLNQIYLGHGAYGVQAASENYFGKSVEELNLAECAVLAGLPQAPSRYSPFQHPERARQRQVYVLKRMREEGHITAAQEEEALQTAMDIKPRRNYFLEQVPIYTEHIRQYVEKKYGEEALYTRGLKIYTAVNIEIQKAAEREISKGLRELDRREGYRGPLRRVAPDRVEAFSRELQKQLDQKAPEPETTVEAVVVQVNDKSGKVRVRMGDQQGVIDFDDMRWARKPNPDVPYDKARLRRPSQALRPGDVILVQLVRRDEKSGLWTLSLDQTPEVQSALVCIEAGTGLVKAMVGGRDFAESQFNRAIQSRRQPGSAFKPIIYAAALDHGYTPASVIIDAPIEFKDASRDTTWRPKNYGERFYGPTLFREALAKSRNVVTIKIMQDIGVDTVIAYARKLGIESDLGRNLSLALGSSGVSLYELVKAYSVFANQGYKIEPAFVTKIEDRDGNLLEEMDPAREKVIDKSTAYIMTSLLESVIQSGTAQKVKELNRPSAGKTGTTNDLFDAWFVGYTPQYITGVWVGYDQKKMLGEGETGARAASPIWLDFMQDIHKNEPVRVFQVPEGVVFAKIDGDTGLLPGAGSRRTLFECFKEDTAPRAYSATTETISEPDHFFKQDM